MRVYAVKEWVEYEGYCGLWAFTNEAAARKKLAERQEAAIEAQHFLTLERFEPGADLTNEGELLVAPGLN